MASLDLAAWCSRLPVAEALPRVAVALAEHGAAVLEAPPGAGKTTLVPLMLLEAAWLQGRRILMLEPRRLAARAAARRMATMLGELSRSCRLVFSAAGRGSPAACRGCSGRARRRGSGSATRRRQDHSGAAHAARE